MLDSVENSNVYADRTKGKTRRLLQESGSFCFTGVCPERVSTQCNAQVSSKKLGQQRFKTEFLSKDERHVHCDQKASEKEARSVLGGVDCREFRRTD
jgi:hypothetical protein